MRDKGTMPDAGELAKDPVFAVLSERRRRNVLLRAHRRSFNPGEVIFDEDAPAEAVYFLATGTVRLTRRVFGRTRAVGTEHAPSALLTIGLFDQGSSAVTAVATTHCDVWVLDRDVFLHMCMACPEAAVDLLRRCARQVRQLVSLADVLALASVRQRVAIWLIEMSDATGSTEFRMPMSQEQLAERLGTVREVLFRNLKYLQDRGIIHFRRQQLMIDDLPRLRTAAAVAGPEHVFVASRDGSTMPMLVTR